MERTSEDIVDEWLVLRAQAGEAEAFGKLARRWEGRVLRHAWRMTRDADGALDVAQESWLSIVKGLGSLADPRAFRGWALGIVTRRSADWVRGKVRRRRARRGVEAMRVVEEASGVAEESADARAVHRAMEGLSREHAAVVGLRYAEGLSVEEIAMALDVPVGTVKSRLHHARGALRRALELEEGKE
ncbi:MAG: RNA polymerase sigma factor [Phycisphaerales bacterium]